MECKSTVSTSASSSSLENTKSWFVGILITRFTVCIRSTTIGILDPLADAATLAIFCNTGQWYVSGMPKSWYKQKRSPLSCNNTLSSADNQPDIPFYEMYFRRKHVVQNCHLRRTPLSVDYAVEIWWGRHSTSLSWDVGCWLLLDWSCCHTTRVQCKHRILYSLWLGPLFPNDVEILRLKVGLGPDQMLNWLEKC